MIRLAPALLAAFLGLNAWAYNPKEVNVDAHQLPKELVNVGVDEHLGAVLDKSLAFKDETGADVTLAKYFNGGEKPVLMAMVYYNCPSLCSLHLNGLTGLMKELKWTTGQDYELVTVSMDSRETPDLAAKKKHNYLQEYGRPEGANGWHFLTGNEANVQALAKQLGFRFQYLEDKGEFAHAAVAYVITPKGKISRYLHGVQPDIGTFKMSLLEASSGKIGSVVEQVLMFCLKFDPTKGKYTLYAWNIMRIGAVLMVLLLAIVLVPVWMRENSPKRT
jgi:protein SCO1